MGQGFITRRAGNSGVSMDGVTKFATLLMLEDYGDQKTLSAGASVTMNCSIMDGFWNYAKPSEIKLVAFAHAGALAPGSSWAGYGCFLENVSNDATKPTETEIDISSATQTRKLKISAYFKGSELWFTLTNPNDFSIYIYYPPSYETDDGLINDAGFIFQGVVAYV